MDFGLPICLPAGDEEASIGFPARRLAAEAGVVVPDHVADLSALPSRQAFEHVLLDLPPGVTEVVLRPALDVPEIRGLDPNWSRRVEDYFAVFARCRSRWPAGSRGCDPDRLGPTTGPAQRKRHSS